MKVFTRLKRRTEAGFTLLEVLLVVAVIAILSGIVILAINPGKNLAEARNSDRSADVSTILNAMYQYNLDNNGSFPPAGGGAALSTTPTEICRTGGTCTGLIDLSPLTSSGTYLVAIPSDPQCPTVCNANGVGYVVSQDANGRLTVSAPDAENDTITVSR